MKKVSVVVITHNAEGSIGKVLAALERQDYKSFEVVVVDDNSKDRTVEVVREFKRFKLIRNKTGQGLAKSINRGIKASRGEVVITLHDDCVPLSDDWISNLVGTFELDPKIGIASSSFVINFKALSPVDKCFSFVYYLGDDVDLARKDGVEDIETISDKCDAYRRDVLEEVKLFDETFRVANEDMDISKKVKAHGYRIVKNNKCKVEHIFTESERERTVWDHFLKAFKTTEQSVYVLLRYGMTYKIDTLLVILSSVVCWLAPFLTLPFYILSLPLSGLFSVFGILAFAAVYYTRPELVWQPSLALTIGIFYIIAKNFAKSLLYVKRYGKLDMVIPILSFCIAWDAASGLGWIFGIFNFIRAKISSNS